MAPQHEFVPQTYAVDSSKTPSSKASLYLRSQDKQGITADFSFEAIRSNVFRTRFTTAEHPLPPHPSLPLPEIRHGDSVPATTLSKTSYQTKIGDVVAEVDFAGCPQVSLSFADSDAPLHADLPYRSYATDGTGVAHYTKYKRGTLHVGLGEKAAPMDLSNRQFVLSATDCFGYDVYRTDPMYKHIPLLINATPEGCVGVFSTSHARGFYSVGSEMDGMWGYYKVYRQDHGGLEEYLIISRTLKELVRTYADLVGYPLLVPRWAFGYLAGGMKYSMLDEPRACDALIDFAKKMKEEDIPCSGFQMSSGYTVAETEPKTRNVFTWNRHRFPDPKAFIDEYHKQGIRLIFNVKPYVLANHPEYEKLNVSGALVKDLRTGKSGTARLWSAGGGESGEGGHIDFTSKAGFQWWYNGIRDLKKLGVDCIWNDNNEYTIPDDHWQCELDEPSVQGSDEAKQLKHIGYWGRALQTELMAKSSHDATVEVEPELRPYVLTRSATAGSMRYCASSWSGDNVTSYDGMKGANAIALTAGMCLLQCYGHDIGGFEGPQPTPELLVRWVQLGIYSSRFAINCFKTTPTNNNLGEVIEPWMYPEATPLVRAAIKRRYEMLPYIYSLALESHAAASPPQRWTGWGYEADPVVWENRVIKNGETQFWLGDSLLVGGVFEPGETKAKMYLPRKSAYDPGFLNLNKPFQFFAAGQWVEVDSKWDASIPVLARIGGAVPVGKDVQTLSAGETANPASLPKDDYRAVEIFPPPLSAGTTGTFETTWLEDDGVSPTAEPVEFRLSYRCCDALVEVELARSGSDVELAWKEEELSVILPVADAHEEVTLNGRKLSCERTDQRGRKVFCSSAMTNGVKEVNGVNGINGHH
ncbi:hypothetical protein H2201_004017 [Coniosporium apollinis]|uniref:alpha-glucosidase n=2 Tax=Coniosporium TaxID=2810619 RepID=A0ABQ9NVC4_9PEZI|nr:hypothetical protein H2201_004017 [Coniosporium apollinis]